MTSLTYTIVRTAFFANDQKDVLAKLTSGKSQLAENKKYTEPGGYILNLSPYQRINDEIEVQARVNKNVGTVKLVGVTKNKTLDLKTEVKDGTVTAKISKDELKQLGVDAEGKIQLFSDDKNMQEVNVMFNVPESQLTLKR